MTGIRLRLREVFGFDLRSLAILRIGLGIAVLLSVWSFARDWRDLFAHDAVLSVSAAYAMAGPEVDPFMAPFWFAPGLAEWLLPVALTLCGLALTLGFYTRPACAVCWYVLYCLQVRNPLINDYSDDVILRVLFWGIFLPLAARFSLDARRARPAPASANPCVSVASAALLLQIIAIYLVAGFKKTGPDWQQDYTAVWFTLQGYYRGTPLSSGLLDYPRLMALATWITPRFEVAIGLALLVPFATSTVRMLAAALLLGFHGMLALCITLNAAPLVSGVLAISLLPGAFWDRFAWLREGAVAGEPSASAAPAASRARQVAGRVGQLLLAVPVLVMLIYDGLEIAETKNLTPVSVHWLGETLRITQQWDMFAPSVTNFDGWFLAPGVLANGNVVDLLRDGAPVRTEPPESLPWLGDDYRMGLVRERVRLHLETLGNDYGRWLCNAWNRDHSGGERLDHFELVWMNVELRHGVREAPTRRWLIRRRCERPPEPAERAASPSRAQSPD